MIGKRILVIIMLVSVTITSGCWSRKELNELAVVMALGIDTHEDGYAVSAQVLNASETGAKQNSSSMGSLPVITYTSVGKTIPDALQRMLSMAPRALYLSHLRVLIFGEELARQGVGNTMDFISRNHELRTDFFLLVAKGGRASDILEVITPFEYIPANSLFSSILISQKRWAATGKITLQMFITELKRDGSDPVLSGVQLRGSVQQGRNVENVKKIQPDTMIQHAGLAVFKRDRLVGWLDESRSKGVNYILNRVVTTVGDIECAGGGVAAYEIHRADSTTHAHLNEKGEPEFRLEMEIEANLSAVECAMKLDSPDVITDLEKRIEDRFNTNIAKHIRYVQSEYGADVFGFGEALHRQHPKVWKKYRDNWDERFRTVQIQVNANVAIRRIGSIVQPINEEVDEP